MSAARPLDDFRALVTRLPALDEAAGDAVMQLFAAQGAGSSRLAQIVATVARAKGAKPSVLRPSLALFAGTHGIARQGISARKLDATLQALSDSSSGDAPVSHLCAANMIGLKVYDLALHMPAADISTSDAMDERNAAATLAFGMEAIAGGTDCLLLSSIATPGDETVAAALLCHFLGGEPADWLPQDEFFEKRADLVTRAMARPVTGDALAQLAALGGREFAAMAGAIVAARTEKLPVILEGVTALAAAAALAGIDRSTIGHCLLASAPDGAAMLAAEKLGLAPIVANGFSAGEGTAAALAVSILRDALALHAGFAAHARSAHTH